MNISRDSAITSCLAKFDNDNRDLAQSLCLVMEIMFQFGKVVGPGETSWSNMNTFISWAEELYRGNKYTLKGGKEQEKQTMEFVSVKLAELRLTGECT